MGKKEEFLSGEGGGDEEEEEEPIDLVQDDVEVAETSAEPAPAPEAGNSLVKPVADVGAVAEVYEQYEEVKAKLLKEADKQTIGSGKNKNTFITKSGWRKIATAFNVSVDVTEKQMSVEDGVLRWRVKSRATAPNGKVAESWASCASNESNHMEFIGKNSKSVEQHKLYSKGDPNVFKVDGNWRRLKEPKEVNDHDILATAETRAKNRAISDLVGGGDVSAEEVNKDSVLE